jgi:hypothetical protein
MEKDRSSLEEGLVRKAKSHVDVDLIRVFNCLFLFFKIKIIQYESVFFRNSMVCTNSFCQANNMTVADVVHKTM